MPIGTVIAWPIGSDPSGIQEGRWLECNGQSVNSSKYPRLAALMSNVPDYRGMFLRGLGSQSYNQNNGGAVGTTSTTYSSSSLGAIQGDAIREIAGAIGHNVWAGPRQGSDYTRFSYKGEKTNNAFYLLDSGVATFSSPNTGGGNMDNILFSNSYGGGWQEALARYDYNVSLSYGSDKDGNTFVNGVTLNKTGPTYPTLRFFQVSGSLAFAASQVSPVGSEIRPVNKAVRYLIKAK